MFDLDSEDVRMLADLGFLAISRGLDFHAEALFDGLRALRPTQEAGHLGHAMVLLFRKDYEAAFQHLKKQPPSDSVMTFTALALLQKGEREEAYDLFRNILETAPGTPLSEIARVCLEEHGKAQ